MIQNVNLFHEILRFIYLMLNYATFYQRFKQRIYIMLNDATLYQSDWLLKTTSFESLYRELPPAYPKQTHDK